ncbi:hypothetical protein HDU76_000606 [Blyttiomyces sp. JEL0837]|nr:hypothetical protein HDU76_000606 [Blyttiomyces sp. JEL0837]
MASITSATASSSKASTSEIINLYRGFLRLQKKWPQQEGRERRLSIKILNDVRNGFRSVDGNLDLVKAKREFEALKRILDGQCEKKYPLPQSSTIMSRLPPAKTYQLLDENAQEALSEKNVSTATFLPTYLWSSIRRQFTGKSD